VTKTSKVLETLEVWKFIRSLKKEAQLLQEVGLLKIGWFLRIILIIVEVAYTMRPLL